MNKFSIFCASYTKMPFVYKKAVFESAMVSALLYRSESWFTNKTKMMEKQYNKHVKYLLEVLRIPG